MSVTILISKPLLHRRTGEKWIFFISFDRRWLHPDDLTNNNEIGHLVRFPERKAGHGSCLCPCLPSSRESDAAAKWQRMRRDASGRRDPEDHCSLHLPVSSGYVVTEAAVTAGPVALGRVAYSVSTTDAPCTGFGVRSGRICRL
jgi:hypothetical protein